MRAIQANHIVKTYKTGKLTVMALSDISINVDEGELFGVIGPDGAGKTSLLRILATLLLPDSGEAKVHGYDVIKDYKKIRQSIGYMPGRFSLYPDLSVEENLRFFAAIFKTSIQENYDLIKDIYIQIEPFKKRRAGELSGGMKQKLALCCALIHRPAVLLLDEPTTGVDAVSRKEFWAMLKGLKSQGITILVSTPYMDEASLCDKVALLQDGKILSINTPQGITAAYTKPLWAVKSARMFSLLQDLRKLPFTERCYPFGEYHHLVVKDENITPYNIEETLKPGNYEHLEVRKAAPGIEDCFLDLMTEIKS